MKKVGASGPREPQSSPRSEEGSRSNRSNDTRPSVDTKGTELDATQTDRSEPGVKKHQEPGGGTERTGPKPPAPSYSRAAESAVARSPGEAVLNHAAVAHMIPAHWPEILAAVHAEPDGVWASVRQHPSRWPGVRDALAQHLGPQPSADAAVRAATTFVGQRGQAALPYFFADAPRLELEETYRDNITALYRQAFDPSVKHPGSEGFCVGLVLAWAERNGAPPERLDASERQGTFGEVFGRRAHIYQNMYDLAQKPDKGRGTREAYDLPLAGMNRMLKSHDLKLVGGWGAHQPGTSEYDAWQQGETPSILSDALPKILGDHWLQAMVAAQAGQPTTFVLKFNIRADVLDQPGTTAHAIGVRLGADKEGGYSLEAFEPNVGLFKFKGPTDLSKGTTPEDFGDFTDFFDEALGAYGYPKRDVWGVQLMAVAR